ncbi:hypothetical protein EGW08_006065 [Elysia chlorotica]|uniref:Transmembrane protein 45B n=1 Tax=Elysia chlorotica TaxID=188477 RepID=A0A3S0ZT79_ELYCH|nr:hypothetical protein EGW08_006065 [Elysia chlorotica]
MYAFFLLSGMIDAMCYLGAPLPDGIQYCSMALALIVEGLLFSSHVHGREILDIHIHMLPVKVIAATVCVLLLEARYRRHPLLPLSRAFLLMLQGTWFWAISVILYKHGEGHSEWDLNSPASVMMATIYFSWHCGAILIIMLVMNMIMACFYHRQSQNGTKYSILSSENEEDNDNITEDRSSVEV